MTNALGQVTQVTSHDGAGRPLTTVDANGVTTTLTYAPQGWLTSIAVAGSGGTATTTIAYDAIGEITQITRPDGSFLAYTYDAAHRLTQVSDAAGETISYTLDAMGDRTQTQIAASGGAHRQVTVAGLRRSRAPAAEHRRRRPDHRLRL